MDLEEIETIYKKDIDKAEKEFLEGIKNSKDMGKIEKRYKETLNVSREKYYNLVSSFIKKQSKENRKKENKKDSTERFKLDESSLEISRYGKFKAKFGLFIFKLKFNLRNFKRRNVPHFLSILNIKIKFKLRKIYDKINNLISLITEKLRNTLDNLRESIKEFIKKLMEKTKDLPEKGLSLFKRKKNKKTEEENKDEEDRNEEEEKEDK